MAISIDELSWLTGSWAGPTDTHTLEENWTRADNGAMAGVMRFIANGRVEAFELILIEEEDDTLVLRVNQWFPGFAPKLEQPDVMRLSNMTDRSATFETHGYSRMSELTYCRAEPDVLKIEIAVTGRELIIMALQAVD